MNLNALSPNYQSLIDKARQDLKRIENKGVSKAETLEDLRDTTGKSFKTEDLEKLMEKYDPEAYAQYSKMAKGADGARTQGGLRYLSRWIDGVKRGLKDGTVSSADTNNIAQAKSSNEEYLKTLQKQVPYIKLQIGYGLNASNDGKINVFDVNPKLLEKMQNDPEAAKEYTQRLKDIEAATKWVDGFHKSMGRTAIVRHGYVDENGRFSSFSIIVKKDELNERLRQEAQENAEKRIERSREKVRENAELLAEKMSEKSEEKKAEKKEDQAIPNKSERLLDEKIAASKDGVIYLNDTDMKTIMEAIREDRADRANLEDRALAGANMDLKA